MGLVCGWEGPPPAGRRGARICAAPGTALARKRGPQPAQQGLAPAVARRRGVRYILDFVPIVLGCLSCFRRPPGPDGHSLTALHVQAAAHAAVVPAMARGTATTSPATSLLPLILASKHAYSTQFFMYVYTRVISTVMDDGALAPLCPSFIACAPSKFVPCLLFSTAPPATTHLSLRAPCRHRARTRTLVDVHSLVPR